MTLAPLAIKLATDPYMLIEGDRIFFDPIDRRYVRASLQSYDKPMNRVVRFADLMGSGIGSFQVEAAFSLRNADQEELVALYRAIAPRHPVQ